MGNPPLALDKPSINAQKVMWAAVTLTLSNIGTLLKQVKDILEAVTSITSIVPKQIPFWVIEGIIGIAVLVGNVILFRFLFEKLKARLLPGKQFIAALVAALIIGIVVVFNLNAMTELRADPLLTQTRLLSEISSAQQPGETQ